MKRSWEVSRRACLRGAGATLALPFLEAMGPGIRQARGASSPQRLVFFIFTGGTPETTNITDEGRHGCFKPSTTGYDYQLTRLLQPLADLKQDITVISNLHNSIGVVGMGKYAGGDHQRSETALLTAINPEYADGPNTVAGISVDQVAASTLKTFTPGLPSIYLSNPTLQHLMSWSAPTSRVNPIEKPSQAFARIFGDTSADPKTLQKRLAFRKSLLDHVKTDADILRKKLGRSDQETLDKYLTSVHDLEDRIAASSSQSTSACSPSFMPRDPKSDQDIDLPGHYDQMLKLLALSFQCDRTRVGVVQLFSHGMWMNWMGPPYDAYPSWHDDIEHGGGAAMFGFADVATRLDTYERGATWQIEQFGNLVRQLKQMPEADGSGSLLDNTILACTSEISYGNGHSMHHLPVIVAGRGGGAVTPGRHLEVREQPIANLWLSMLNAVGANATSFGNSTGPLSLT